VTHVPLLFCGPGIKARQIDTPRGSVDLAPTVMELWVTGDPGFVGKSLVSELRAPCPIRAPSRPTPTGK
jgi:arylsulfatase A-like enzyme